MNLKSHPHFKKRYVTTITNQNINRSAQNCRASTWKRTFCASCYNKGTTCYIFNFCTLHETNDFFFKDTRLLISMSCGERGEGCWSWEVSNLGNCPCIIHGDRLVSVAASNANSSGSPDPGVSAAVRTTTLHSGRSTSKSLLTKHCAKELPYGSSTPMKKHSQNLSMLYFTTL